MTTATLFELEEHFDTCEKRNKKEQKRKSQADLGSFLTKKNQGPSLGAVTVAQLRRRLQKVSRMPKIQPLTRIKMLNFLLQRDNPRTCKGQKYLIAVYVNYTVPCFTPQSRLKLLSLDELS